MIRKTARKALPVAIAVTAGIFVYLVVTEPKKP